MWKSRFLVPQTPHERHAFVCSTGRLLSNDCSARSEVVSSDSSPNPPKRPPFGHANARPSNRPSLGRDSGASESFAPESLWIMLTSLEVATCHTSIESSSTDQRKEREKARKLNVQYNNIYHTIAQENRIRLQPSLIHATNSKRLLCVDLPFEESLLACGSSDGCPFVRRARIAK